MATVKQFHRLPVGSGETAARHMPRRASIKSLSFLTVFTADFSWCFVPPQVKSCPAPWHLMSGCQLSDLKLSLPGNQENIPHPTSSLLASVLTKPPSLLTGRELDHRLAGSYHGVPCPNLRNFSPQRNRSRSRSRRSLQNAEVGASILSSPTRSTTLSIRRSPLTVPDDPR
jgi:hypothetical protein